MKKSVLLLYHGEKVGIRTPIAVDIPEPEPKSKILISRIDDSGKGWQASCLSVAGTSRLFSYRHYHVRRPVVFIIEPSEPVVCLRIHVGHGAIFSYDGEEEGLELDFRDNHIFWQGGRITENYLIKGEYYIIELYLRPECLAHLSDRQSVMEIIDQSLSELCSPIDQYVFGSSAELDIFLTKLLEEIENEDTSVERFNYLCDCLLLLCLGEDIDVQRRPKTGKEILDERQMVKKKYEPSVSEKQILAELEGMPRMELLVQVHDLQETMEKLKQRVELEQETWRAAKCVADVIRKSPLDRLAKIYMEAAYFLADWIANRKTEGIKEMLKLAVVKACEDAFELKLPTPDEIEFYVKWSGKPYVAKTTDIGKLTDLLTLLSPDVAKIDIGEENSRNSYVLIERIKDSLDLNKTSDFTPEMAKDKPKEVVDLYQELMEHFCETLDLREGKIRRSDIVRELDAAYEYNDLVALLQIEAEYFAGDADYVRRQDNEKLIWLIVALRFGTESHSLWLEEIKEDRVYHDLQRFHRLGSDMDKYKRFIRKYTEGLEQATNELAFVMEDIMSFPTEGKVIILAEFILSRDSEE